MYNKEKNSAGGAQVAQQHADEKRVYTLKDMAKMFSVTIRTIYNWMDDGRFSFVKIGSKTYVADYQIQEFLSANTVKSFKVGRNYYGS